MCLPHLHLILNLNVMPLGCEDEIWRQKTTRIMRVTELSFNTYLATNCRHTISVEVNGGYSMWFRVPRCSQRYMSLWLEAEDQTVRTMRWSCYRRSSLSPTRSSYHSRTSTESWDFRSLRWTPSASCCKLPTHIHTLLYGYPTGDSVQTGLITNRGQSPIGGCVFKQMSPLVGAYKSTPTHLNITTVRSNRARVSFYVCR